MKLYAVGKRLHGERRDIREFVQPWSLPVREVAATLERPTMEDTIVACWGWVAREIDYPPGPVEKMDRHYQESFLSGGLLPNVAGFRSTVYDHWSFPAETLALRTGDCEDAAILMASLLRNFLPEEQVFVSAGLFGRWGGHAWVTALNGRQPFTLEATLAEALPGPWVIPEEEPYQPFLRFNDVAAVEIKELPAGFLSRRLSADGTLRAVSDFYTAFGVASKR